MKYPKYQFTGYGFAGYGYKKSFKWEKAIDIKDDYLVS